MRIEGAGADQVFQLALVEQLGIEPAGEIEEVLERRPSSAHLATRSVHGALADILDRRQRIADGAAVPSGSVFHAAKAAVAGVLDAKVARERLMSGGSSLIFSRSSSCLKMFSLSVLPRSSVIDAAKNSTGIVRLQPRRLIGDQRVGAPRGILLKP